MTENAAPAPLDGVVLDGRYQIERLLGEGGMGMVYSATDRRLDKRVAIKIIARELAANPEALERFRREARVTSGLGHPNIVQVFDFSATPGGEPFFVLELLEGEDLDRRLRRTGRLPLPGVVHIISQVASALAATHAKGIVHRDLKPGNICLLDITGTRDFVKVLDFGISKVRAATMKLTRTSSVMGTPNYMSPEQAKGRVEEIDEATDQWALACIAWECLCGEGPFLGENVPSILFQIVHEPPRPLGESVPGLGAAVEDVLLRALAKNKRDRFPSVTDFAAALAATTSHAAPGSLANLSRSAVPPASAAPAPTALLSSTAASGPPGPIPPTTFSRTAGELEEGSGPRQATPFSRKLLWALAACGLAALLVGAFLAMRPRTTPTPAVAAQPTVVLPAVVTPPLAAPYPAVAPPPPSAAVVPPPAAEPKLPGTSKATLPRAEAASPSSAPPASTSSAPPARTKPSKAKSAPAKAKVVPTSPPAGRAPLPTKKASEDQWRVD